MVVSNFKGKTMIRTIGRFIHSLFYGEVTQPEVVAPKKPRVYLTKADYDSIKLEYAKWKCEFPKGTDVDFIQHLDTVIGKTISSSTLSNIKHGHLSRENLRDS